MKPSTEKEGNSIVDKLVQILIQAGNRMKPKTIRDFLDDENAHNRHQTEEEYQKEQADWLKRAKKKELF